MKRSIYMDRFMSMCYDIIFIALSIYLLIISLNFLNNQYIQMKYFTILIIILCVIVYILEYTIMAIKLKGTLGHYLNDLSIGTTNGKITVGKVLLREVVLKHLLYVTVIGLVGEMVFILIRRHTIHDYLLKTTIIKKQMKKEGINRSFL